MKSLRIGYTRTLGTWETMTYRGAKREISASSEMMTNISYLKSSMEKTRTWRKDEKQI